jgi:hypothetical protein
MPGDYYYLVLVILLLGCRRDEPCWLVGREEVRATAGDWLKYMR